jgi:hypothetical protein
MNSTVNTVAQLLVVVAVLGLVIGRRFQPRPVRGDARRWRLPLILMAVGLYSVVQLTKGSHPITLNGNDVGYLVLGGLLSLALGAARGMTIRIFDQGGVLVQRYAATTAALWVATIAVRLGLDAAAPSFGVAKAVAGASIMFMFGISLLGEAAAVTARTSTGFAAQTLR